MTFQRFRAALVFGLLALVASACGGSDAASPSDPASGSDTDAAEAVAEVDPVEAEPVETEPVDPTEDESAIEQAQAAAEAEAAAAAAAEAAGPYDPRLSAQNFARALFNLQPDEAAIDCIVAEAEAKPNLELAFQENQPVFNEFGDEKLYAITTSMNGCLDGLGLGGWATEAVGPEGEVRETAPACFAEEFADPELGDDLFHTLVALSFQYRYDPELEGPMTATLATCAPITGLATVFVNQAEQLSNYATEIDRDCFLETISDRSVSEEFWSTLIDGSQPPTNVVQPYLASCATVVNEGLADAVPGDFVPWSGTGALTAVAPPARANVYSGLPPMSIDPAIEYTAVFATGGGEVRVRLFADSAPVTVNNFVSLARDGFFDGTTFHRVFDDFMAQGGDPTGSGASGPGYSFQDEFDDSVRFDRPGMLAMANSGANTNGSGFFITLAPTDWLDGLHTIFGEVVEGQEIVDAIERRDPQAPQGRGQVLDSVTIIEG